MDKTKIGRHGSPNNAGSGEFLTCVSAVLKKQELHQEKNGCIKTPAEGGKWVAVKRGK